MENQNNKANAFQHKRQPQDTQNSAEPVKINPQFEDLKQPETLFKPRSGNNRNQSNPTH